LIQSISLDYFMLLFINLINLKENLSYSMKNLHILNYLIRKLPCFLIFLLIYYIIYYQMHFILLFHL